MTVNYSLQVSHVGILTALKLFAKWRGSVYKALYSELILYFLCYAFLSILYRLILTPDQQTVFENLTIFCDKFSGMVPMTFILGFYVSIVFTRWNDIYNSIPWPDTTSLTISTYLSGREFTATLYRKTIARYLVAAQVLVLRDISSAVHKRFPTYQHVVEAGLLTDKELDQYLKVTDCGSHRYWIVIHWSLNVLKKARKDGRIASDFLYHNCVQAVLQFRVHCGTLLGYDWISVPLIYTQVVSLTVWYYFVACLLGRQYLDPIKGYPGHELDLYFPPFTFFQFLFYIGWLKAAQSMLNPLGEDDNDFELNYIIDRNIKVAYTQMEETHDVYPELVDEGLPTIPHTVGSAGTSDNPHIPSFANVEVSTTEAVILPEIPEVSEHGSNAGTRSGTPTSSIDGRRSGTNRRMSVFRRAMENVARKISTQQTNSPSLPMRTTSVAGRRLSRHQSSTPSNLAGIDNLGIIDDFSTENEEASTSEPPTIGGTLNNGQIGGGLTNPTDQNVNADEHRLGTLAEEGTDENPATDDDAKRTP